MVFTISSKTLDVTDQTEKYERVWKQYVFCFIAYFPFFTRNLQSTYLTLTPRDGIPETPNGVPWSTTGYILGALISAPIFCCVADKWGRRIVAILISAFQAISWIILLSGTNYAILIITNTITGIATGGIFTILPVYVKEITNKKYREISVCMMMLMTSCGFLAMRLLIMFVEEMTVLYMVLALVMLQFLMMFALVETTSYLVMKGQDEAATFNLSKLKGLDLKSSNISKEIFNLKDESDRANFEEKSTVFKIIKNRIYREATKIGIVLHTCYAYGGKLVFLDHNKVLESTGIDLEKVVSEFTIPCLMVGGCLVAIVFLVFWEHKYLLSISFFVMALAFGILGVFMQADMRAPDLPWIPIASHAVLVFGYAVGWGVPYLVMVEVLNMKIRATVTGILYTYTQILHLIHVHTFQYVEESIGLYTMCYVFSAVNMYGAVYSVFAVPVIKKKSITYIEKKLNKIPIWKL